MIQLTRYTVPEGAKMCPTCGRSDKIITEGAEHFICLKCKDKWFSDAASRFIKEENKIESNF